MTLPIHWTKHARERVAERLYCEGWRVIPTREIACKASQCDVDEVFVARQGLVRYVCKRVDCGILVLTVYKRKRARR